MSPHKKSCVTEDTAPMKTWEVGELYQGNFLIFPICAPHPVTRQLLLQLQSRHLTFLQEPTEGFHPALTWQYLYRDGGCPQ